MPSNAELCAPLVTVEAEQGQDKTKLKSAIALVLSVALVSGVCVAALEHTSSKSMMPTNLVQLASNSTAPANTTSAMPKWIQYGVGGMVGVLVLAFLYAKLFGTKKNLQQRDEQRQESQQRWEADKSAVKTKVFTAAPENDQQLGELMGIFENVNAKGHSIWVVDSTGNVKQNVDEIAALVQGGDADAFPLQLTVRAKDNRTVTLRAGKSGMQTDSEGKVTAVAEPAKSSGVQEGWKIVAINGNAFTPSLLSEMSGNSRKWPYDVKFSA